MGVELHAELDRIFAARDRNNMAPTIAALLPLYEQHPRDPRVLYEVGGAYDTAGEEATAVGFYERAMAEGWKGIYVAGATCNSAVPSATSAVSMSQRQSSPRRGESSRTLSLSAHSKL